MNILVISSYFGPETSVGVLRINSFVKYWARLGHTIHVVTMPFCGELPDGIRGNPRIKISQISPFFIKNQKTGGVQGYAKGATGFVKKLVKLQYWLKRQFLSNYLDPRLLWWPRVSYYICNKLMKETKFDFMFSTVPSYTAHSAAAVVRMFNSRLVWVADYRDLWTGNPIFPGCGLVRFVEKFHEKFVLRNARLIVSINQPLISELTAIHGNRRYGIVPNGFDDHEVNVFERLELGERFKEISVIYAGSILPGLQDPTPLFQAIKELATEGKIREGDLMVRFYGDYSALNDYSMANDEVVSKFITLCGKVARSDILKIQKNADFLLFLGSKPVTNGVGSTAGVVSGKIFEYLISGTEVMAVGVTEDMLVAEMVKKAAAGDYYGRDVEKLKKRIVDAVQSGVVKVSPDMTYLGQFRRSVQASKLIAEIQHLV